ncbi:MAG TPA: hypothetical protein VFT70_08520 [Nocardioides sp.]|nr:hypothetical protein [Nocardioides sp.]
MTTTEPELRSRWRGQPGRLEVWYTTITDPASGTGLWIHHELVAPTDGGEAHVHGWVAVFEPGAAPVLERFGPGPWSAPDTGFACGEVRYDGTLVGRAGAVSWELSSDGAARTLHTFPRWAWQREVLPAAQVVPRPTARYSGVVRTGDRELVLRDAPGADARIYGHGNAQEWGWLHADLGGGEVCEVVAAVSMRPGLNRLPPLPLVALRLGDGDVPRDPLLASFGLRARLRRDGFDVRGRLGRRRLTISVDLPEVETVEVDYRDPDGAPLLCRNSELATARIELFRGSTVERSWRLYGTAHAEVGGFR